MKKNSFVFLMILTATFAYGQDKVSISYFLSQPHILYDSSTKKVSGAVHELIENYVAPKMSVTFVWDSSPSNVPRQLKNLEEGKKDAVALLIFTPDRAKKYAYTEKAYTTSKSVIGLLSDHPLNRVNKIEDILNLKIGYAKKFYISPFMRDKRVKFDLISSSNPNETNLRKLLVKRIDAFYIPDKAGMLLAMRNLGVENKVKVLELPDRGGNSHVVFSKANQKMAERWNKAFAEVNGENLYRQILNKYIDASRL